MIIRVESDSGDPTYDFFLVSDDEKVSPTQALEQVARAIKSVKAEYPEEYTIEDLWEALPDGIEPANILTCSEDW